MTVLTVKGLEKTYFIGFFRKRVDAVRGIDFEVRPGEVFGLLGPNGAGKTSTIKMLLRLTFPTRGTITMFDKPIDRAAMARLGYLPESPYVYQYLKPLEFLDLCGRLVGMDRATREKRSKEMVERVGLAHAVDRPIGRFSKGMMQRIGLAQAVLHDPELLVLDEPMSGLDPIGRKEVRDLLVEERARGKTLLFTSHILSDVELLCDRVAIMHQGKVTAYGELSDLLAGDAHRVEIDLGSDDETLIAAIEPHASKLSRMVGHTVAIADGEEQRHAILRVALDRGVEVRSVQAHRETLEALFVRGAVHTRDD